ncbi:MAG TPA: GDSL-type esterase/lipase family protein [Anaeromyxobacteraceae bacterium]
MDPRPTHQRALSIALLAAAVAAGVGLARHRAGAATPQPPASRWGGPLVAAPLVSRGKRVTSKPSGGEVLVDGIYRTSSVWAGGHPTPDDPSWVAIRIGGGYERLLLSWTSSGNHDWTDQVYGAPLDYHIETSADSSDGRDGTWRTVVGVADNPVRTRAHAFDFHRQRWVRLVVTRLPRKMNPWGLFLDEIDVHDLSRGGDDTWVFFGDSITSSVFDRAPAHQPSFAEAIAARHPGYFPAVVSAGKSCLHHGDAVRLVDEVLALNPDARVFALGFGSNDSDPAAFRADLVEVIRRVRAAGRIAIVPRIPFRPGSPVDDPARLDAVVDEVTSTLGLPPGPDLYAWFAAHPDQLRDGLHPDDRGAVEMSRLWAEAAAPLYPPSAVAAR